MGKKVVRWIFAGIAVLLAVAVAAAIWIGITHKRAEDVPQVPAGQTQTEPADTEPVQDTPAEPTEQAPAVTDPNEDITQPEEPDVDVTQEETVPEEEETTEETKEPIYWSGNPDQLPDF